MNDEQSTPDYLFNQLDALYGPFDLDAAASEYNHKCEAYYDQRHDAMQVPVWNGTRIWLNPPYSKRSVKTGSYGLRAWIKKAQEQAFLGKRVVMLLPSDTSTSWWHDYIEPVRAYDHDAVTFLRGRVKFNGAGNSAKFANAVVVFDGDGSMGFDEYRAEMAA